MPDVKSSLWDSQCEILSMSSYSMNRIHEMKMIGSKADLAPKGGWMADERENDFARHSMQIADPADL